MDILVYIAIFLGLYFSIFIFSTLWEYRKHIYKEALKENFPNVCLIVPCYNEEQNIDRTLNALLNLDYPKEKLEIIVIDDGSKDNTFLKAKVYEEKDKRIRLFKKENGGKYTALNFAIKKTSAQFIGSVDADSYVETQSLKRLMKYFEDQEIKAVVSTIKIIKAKNILEKIQYLEYLISASFRKVFSLNNCLNVVPGPLSVIRREVFEKIGYYKKAHDTEDMEMAFRMQKANFKIAHAANSIIYTNACSTFKSLFYQRLRWRRGFLLNLKDYTGLLNIKKYGNLSFLLYYYILGGFISTTIIFYGLWKTFSLILGKIINFSLINFDILPLSFPKINLFSFNFTPLLFLGSFGLCIFILYTVISKKITFDKTPLKSNAIFFILLFTTLNTAWWLSAIFSIVIKKEMAWR